MVAFIQRVSLTMPTPTLVNGRPDSTWLPTVARSDWGKLQLIIAGHGMTKQRGVRFLPLSDTSTDPFGDAEATFAFPGLSEFDDPDDWNLRRFAPVRLRRKDADGEFTTLYEGEIESIESPDEPAHGLVISCIGALYRLDLLKQPPTLYQTATSDFGDIIARTVNHKRERYALHMGHMRHVTTGVRGVESADFQPLLSGTLQDYLSQMSTETDDAGNYQQWTISLHRPRRPVLELKDMTTVDATVSYGAPGVDVSIAEDFSTGTTAIFGSGSNGHCTWVGARFPNLVGRDAPAFPLAVGGTFVAGDNQSGFAEFAAYLRRGQYGTIVSDDTYDSADVDNVEQMQDRAGITVDGVVGAQTWEAAFQPGFNQGSVRGAYIDTIFERKATRRHLTNAQGAVIGPNPDFNTTIPRIEDFIPFGDHVSKQQGRKTARAIVDQAYPCGYAGTITLASDPAECSRWSLKAGQNIRLQNFHGGEVPLFHIVKRVRDWQSDTVTLTVDTKGRDLQILNSVFERRKDISDVTRRQRFGHVSSKVFNDYGSWLCEDGAGEIPLMNQAAGQWNVQRVAAAPKGSIERVSLAFGTGLTEHLLNVNLSSRPAATIPGAARGVVALFAKPITARQLVNMTGMSTPVTFLPDGVTNPWDYNADRLARRGMIYAAGGPGAQLGFYPNNDPGDGTDVNLSGRFEDAGSVAFGPTGHYWLWVAIWSPDDCLVGGRLFPGAP